MQTASTTILSITRAFKEIKRFCTDCWEGDYRTAAREALKQILEGQMKNAVDAYLEHLSAEEIADRKNGSYRRHLSHRWRQGTASGTPLGLWIHPIAMKWQQRYPKAVLCLRSDLPELMTFFKVDLPLRAEELRTTNAIERR